MVILRRVRYKKLLPLFYKTIIFKKIKQLKKNSPIHIKTYPNQLPSLDKEGNEFTVVLTEVKKGEFESLYHHRLR